jgi:two-component system sensor histidine kinase/response regulator
VNYRHPNNSRIETKIFIFLGLGLAVLYWIFETLFLNVVVFREGSIVDRLLPLSDPHELLHRLLIVTALLTFSVVIQNSFNKRKRTEVALRDSEERFRHLAEATFEGVAITDEGGIVEANEAFAVMLGYETSEVVGKTVPDLVAPVSRDLVRSKRSSNSEESYEAVMLRKDGTTFEAEVRGKTSSYRGHTSRVTAIRDISERKKSEEALRESEQRFRILTDASLEGITILERGQILEANRACAEMFGYELSEIVGKSALEFIAPEYVDLVRQNISSGYEQPYEAVGVKKDGTRFDMELYGKAFTYRDRTVRVTAMRNISDRKRVELAIRENEKRFRQLFNQSLDAQFIHDASGKIVDCNEEACRSLGYTREELLTLRIRDLATGLISEDEHSKTEPSLWQRALSGEPGKLAGVHQGEHRRKDGTTFPVEVYVGSVDYGGERMIFASARDITERKQAEKELQASEAELRALFGAMNDVILVVDAHGRYLEIAPTNPSLLYKPSEDLIGKTMHEIFPQEQADVFLECIRHALETQQPAHIEYSLPIGEEELWFDGTISPLLEDSVIFVARDITEHKRAEETRSLLAAIVESSNDAIIGTTLGDSITSWNSGAEKLYGYSAEEVVGQPTAILVPPDRPDEIPEILQRLRRGEGLDNFETVRVAKDGRRLDVALTISAIKDSEGNITGASTIARDITQRKQAERELQQAKVEAEAANLAKSEFLANMSHEIRTPMNGVIGMTGLLLDSELTEEQREYAETVRHSGEALLTIVNDILDFSKIEAGRMNLEIIDFDLRTAVEETIGLLGEQAQGKGLELVSLVEYDVPDALRGDPGRIRQVLTNLLGNAIKFTEEGEVVLHTSLAQERADKAVIRFEVTDTGIGMTDEHKRHLFRAFSQADASTTRRYGGTGLGLSISKQLIELMGGEIGVESEPGVGSTFWFTLPMVKQPVGVRTPQRVPADLKDLRVLIVDDNATNRRILSKHLSSWGVESENVEDGTSALERMRAATERGEPYDLAILDMQTPGMDGMELARQTKADLAISSARLVLLTSMGDRGEGEEARLTGIEAYLTKPIKQSELYDTIAMVMGAPEDETTTVERDTLFITRHSLREAEAQPRARVLVAEDNVVNQKVAVRMLEKLGYRTDVAANGLEAVAALSHIPYAAVLMDVQMPEMDGYEATAEIREREDAARHTPVIAMTANAMQGDREKALMAGMDDYISKPVKAQELDNVLKRWISHPDTSSAQGEVTYAADDPLDRSVLAGLRELQEGGEPDLLAELAKLFLEEAPFKIKGMHEATERSDASSLGWVAHALKGSCDNMGARRMAQICAELQDVGTSENLARAPGLLDQLESEFDRVRSALEDQIQRS